VTALMQNAPNPFRATTDVRFTLATRGTVSLEVFDLGGRHVATIADREFEPGTHTVAWAGRGTRGDLAPAGIYFYRMTAPGFTQTRKLILQ
jgi:FlgD Ig-like domain